MDDLNKIITGKMCPYCQCETKIVSGDEVYPHRVNDEPRPKFIDKKYYMCLLDSNHYVGTYNDNITSLGRLANSELRRLKNQGHNTFDPLWRRNNIFKSRKQAYQWLSKEMGLSLELTHFGIFTVEQCRKAILLCENLKNEKNGNI